MEDKSLAFEMLSELKAQNKRQHIVIIILICVIIVITIFFCSFGYDTTYTDETQTIEDVETTNSSFTQTIN